MLYYSLAYPYLQYCITSWGGAADYLISKIFSVQKSFIRTICSKPKLEPSSPLFYQLKMLKLNDIYRLQISKLMYQLKSQRSFGENSLIKVSEIHNHNTRIANNHNYYIPHKRTDIGKRSFSFQGPKIWLEVPPGMKELEFGPFKYNLKNMLLENYND